LILNAVELASGAGHSGKHREVYKGEILFSPQVLRVDDGCIAFGGAVTSGDYFRDFERIENGNNIEFRKHGQLITEYPESLTLSIRIAGSRCDESSWDLAPSFFQNGSAEALKFQGEWKEGMRLRPVEGLTVVSHSRKSSSIHFPDRDLTTYAVEYHIDVNSKGVPLSNHLIISVLTPDGKRLVRLSAAP
jgi:hypothetical protein